MMGDRRPSGGFARQSGCFLKPAGARHGLLGTSNRGAAKAALQGLALAGACLGTATPASASILTFTFQGTVASFIDNNDVFGFGAGANLAGDSITDVYKIDTAYSAFSSSQPFGPGSADNEYNGAYGGMSQATSTSTATL